MEYLKVHNDENTFITRVLRTDSISDLKWYVDSIVVLTDHAKWNINKITKHGWRPEKGYKRVANGLQLYTVYDKIYAYAPNQCTIFSYKEPHITERMNDMLNIKPSNLIPDLLDKNPEKPDFIPVRFMSDNDLLDCAKGKLEGFCFDNAFILYMKMNGVDRFDDIMHFCNERGFKIFDTYDSRQRGVDIFLEHQIITIWEDYYENGFK